MDTNARHRLQQLLAARPVLRTVHDCQEQLRQLWGTVASTKEDSAGRFASWCGRAEASGIQALEEFAGTLRHLALVDRQSAGRGDVLVERSRQRAARSARHGRTSI
jgi:hypothetical protein